MHEQRSEPVAPDAPLTAIHPADGDPETYKLNRRFDRMGRLVGDAGMQRLMSSHVMVMGLGGVGSWAAESLARSGIGRLSLVDFDAVCITNINRQLHAMTGTVGKRKTAVMAERLRMIHPKCDIENIENFYSAETSADLLDRGPSLVIDAIDNITGKAHLLASCRQRGIPVLSSGGSGSRLDPSRILVRDLSETHSDPLLAAIRRVLRTKHGIPTDVPTGIECVFSDEVPTEPEELKYDNGQGFRCVCPQGKNPYHTCEKRSVIYGTASFVTGSFGLMLAARATARLLASEATPLQTVQ